MYWNEFNAAYHGAQEMKKILIVFFVIVALFLAVFIAKDQMLRSTITIAATQITGTKVSIDKFSLGILKQSVRIEGFKLYNPEGFSEGVLIDLPKIAVECDLASLRKGKIHLKLLEVNLREIVIEKNKEGKLNVDSLKLAQEQKPVKQMPMRIDLLNLQMDRLVMKDYIEGKEPSVKAYDIKLKKSYKDITSPQALAALILAEPMKQAGIQGARIYGAALLTGVGAAPIVIVSKLISKDSAEQGFDVPLAKLYDISLQVLKSSGALSNEDKTAGVIAAQVNGAKVTVRLKALSDKSARISVSARKMMLPKPEIASGIIYQISEKLK